ncbi:MAG: hypothetical protein KME55_39610, partial [Nostoc indistinguendum CM1-VF10]|nr:hypothetical protein [Nostoc indistinguendum CM1-VF10]
MWLKFGVAPDGKLVCVEDVGSGKTELLCPYCYGQLTAKKGKVKRIPSILRGRQLFWLPGPTKGITRRFLTNNSRKKGNFPCLRNT